MIERRERPPTAIRIAYLSWRTREQTSAEPLCALRSLWFMAEGKSTAQSGLFSHLKEDLALPIKNLTKNSEVLL